MQMQKLSGGWGWEFIRGIIDSPFLLSLGYGGCGDYAVFFNEFCSPRMSACIDVFLLRVNSLPDFLSHI